LDDEEGEGELELKINFENESINDIPFGS